MVVQRTYSESEDKFSTRFQYGIRFETPLYNLTMTALPPFALFPRALWRQHLSSEEWESLTDVWVTLSEAALRLSDKELKRKVEDDESIVAFVTTFAEETATSGQSTASTPAGSPSASLLKVVFRLSTRLIDVCRPPQLLGFPFLADFAKVYPRKLTSPLLSRLFASHGPEIEASLTALKKLLIPHLDSGIKGDLKLVESRLARVNPLLHASPDACTVLLAGSDFFDGLVSCFRVMNPPLRKVIIATVYLCLMGLVETESPKWAMLGDQLYALKAAADTHKAGPLNANDSLVPELVTSTPILMILLRKADDSGAAKEGLKKRITALQEFKKGPMVRPKRLQKRKIDKGKGRQTQEDVQVEIHVHKMSQITQIQDLFPDLGSGFVSKCLDEYGDDVEQVVANLLSETLPPHLATADRSESLYVYHWREETTSFFRTSWLIQFPFRSSQPHAKDHHDLAPRSTPPQLPARRNVFDDDEFDRLEADTSKVSFGKKPVKTADDILADRSTAPNKAAILSALANFDLDDDERDDTYDATDVGGTVDSANQEADGSSDRHEEALFRAYQMDEKVFDRDATTRRGPARTKLRDETGLTDEAIEGWALMLARNPQQKRRLEAKFAFAGQQAQLGRTAWQANAAGSGEDSDVAGESARGGRGRGRGGGRGRGRGRGGGRGGGDVAGPTGEQSTENARKNKESNKGSRANHNRRNARAKKIARGGFAG